MDLRMDLRLDLWKDLWVDLWTDLQTDLLWFSFLFCTALIDFRINTVIPLQLQFQRYLPCELFIN